MAEGKSGLSDVFADMDLEEDISETGYERDFEVEIIDGFYHQNLAFMNEKVQAFGFYWMKIYSECCLQRDYVMELLNDGKPEDAKIVLRNFPTTEGAPNIPQLLFETQEVKRKKKICSAASIEYDGRSLLREMENNYIRGKIIHFHVPSVFPEGEVSLVDYEMHLKHCQKSFKTIDNYVVKNAFLYGKWLSQAFDKFQEEKVKRRVSGSFDDWVNSRCEVKQTRARQLRKFYKQFSPYKKVCRCTLPLIWFLNNGDAVVKYLESHKEVALPWTHEIDCDCVTCKI